MGVRVGLSVDPDQEYYIYFMGSEHIYFMGSEMTTSLHCKLKTEIIIPPARV